MRKRTREDAERQLNEKLPHLNSNWDFLRRALAHMDVVTPRSAWKTKVFRLFFGLDDGKPLSLFELTNEMNSSTSYIKKVRDQVMERLNHPAWREEKKWPAPVQPKLKPNRFFEISVMLQMWQLHRAGEERYTADLLLAARDLEIKEDEMLIFRDEIGERLTEE